MQIRAHAAGDAAATVPRAPLIAGALAPLLFMVTFTVDGWLRPGFDPVSMFVSELSIGRGGWVQQANFAVTGALIVYFGVGAAHLLPHGRGSSVIPWALVILGLGLVGSGVFTTDPSALVQQRSATGVVHGLLGAVVFTAMPKLCFLVAAREQAYGRRSRLRSWCRAVGALLVVSLVVLKLAELPQLPLFAYRGVVQRAYLVLFFGWLFSFAVYLYRRPEVDP